jgi:hypothetical protein
MRNFKSWMLVVVAFLSIAACTNVLRSGSHETQSGEPFTSVTVSSSFNVNPALIPYLEEFKRTDFSANMASVPSTIEAGTPGAPFSVEADQLQPALYSENELKLMAGRYNGAGRTDLSHVLSIACGFKKYNGVLPKDGAELLAWLWENETSEAERVSKLSRSQQFTELNALVNPVTGKLYESFQAEAWSPGAVSFRELTDLKEIDKAFVDAFGWTPGDGGLVTEMPNFLSVWEIKLYGEEPDEVLGVRPVITMKPHQHEVPAESSEHEDEGLPTHSHTDKH